MAPPYQTHQYVPRRREPVYVKIQCPTGGWLLLDQADFDPARHSYYDPAKEPVYPSVPRLWPGETFVILGDGPSLRQADVDVVRGRARVVAINYSFRMAPWADALWSWHTTGLAEWAGPAIAKYKGLVFSAERPAPGDPPLPANWTRIRGTENVAGFSDDPRQVHHGFNSGYSAINLALHLGAKRIVLLGYDCCDAEDGTFNWAKPTDHATKGTYRYDLWVAAFRTAPLSLSRLGVQVVNASRRTAIDAFPRVALEDVEWDRPAPPRARSRR